MNIPILWNLPESCENLLWQSASTVPISSGCIWKWHPCKQSFFRLVQLAPSIRIPLRLISSTSTSSKWRIWSPLTSNSWNKWCSKKLAQLILNWVKWSKTHNFAKWSSFSLEEFLWYLNLSLYKFGHVLTKCFNSNEFNSPFVSTSSKLKLKVDLSINYIYLLLDWW